MRPLDGQTYAELARMFKELALATIGWSTIMVVVFAIAAGVRGIASRLNNARPEVPVSADDGPGVLPWAEPAWIPLSVEAPRRPAFSEEPIPIYVMVQERPRARRRRRQTSTS